MAATTPPKTPNLSLPLDVHGIYRLQKAVKAIANAVDEKLGAVGGTSLQAQIDDLQSQVTAVLGMVQALAASANDSNSLHVDLTDSNSQFENTP